METFLVKVLALLLALSQVATVPDAIKTQFDRTREQEQAAGLLRAGCTHMRNVFDIEGMDLDGLIATALDDPQATAHDNLLFRGINFADLQAAYRQFCTDQKVLAPTVDLGDVIDFYNKAAAELPDHSKLKGLKLSGTSVLLDGAGRPFADLFEENKRRGIAGVRSPARSHSVVAFRRHRLPRWCTRTAKRVGCYSPVGNIGDTWCLEE